MNIPLPKDLAEFLDEIVQSGLYKSPELAICDALRLLKERVELHKVRVEELRRLIAVGADQAKRGELLDGEAVFRSLRG
jgi:antitoxin ParD1/3/4